MRDARLLVPVRGVSGRTYAADTMVRVTGGGAVADAFVNGDWMPLNWWEFAEVPDPGSEEEPAAP